MRKYPWLLLIFTLLISLSVLITTNAGPLAGVFEKTVFKWMAGGARFRPNPRVAIVIDDFGQQGDEMAGDVLVLGIPVTCAIMPNMENTQKHADEAFKAGHEVIVHLPLEPVHGRKNWLGPGAITGELNEEETKRIVKEDFDAVPHAVGFNNHMGSAITSNEKIMRAILKVAQERGFFVLDSKTTDKSLIPALSKEIGIPCVERNIFLDNVNSEEYIKKQINTLCLQAFKKGEAIAIGHTGRGRKNTVKALKEMIPAMRDMGIEFIYLSKVVYD